MVQKYQSPVRVYKYPFELVMAAYEKRFPTCKMIPVFVGSEIMSEFHSEDGAISIVERRCKLNVEAPYLLKKIIGVDFVYFIQKNSLDRRARTLKIEARNETFNTRVIVHEVCSYSVHPENPEWTCFEQTASLDVKSFLGFESAIEKVAMKQYSQNISKGKEVIEHYINELLIEGVTYIEPYCDKPLLPAISIASAKAESELSSNASRSLEKHSPPASPTSLSDYSASEANFKLESEYIERCVGDLTPFQESCLVQLKKWLADAHQGKVPGDQTMMRFLQAQDYNLEKAREMLCQSLVWRKKYQVDRILSTYNMPQVVKEYFPGGWHYSDKDGRPLYLLRLGQMDVKGFIKSIGQEGLVKLTLHVCEEGLRRAEEATRKRGRPVSSWSCILDLEGLNMRHLWRPGVRTLLHIIEIVEANYPETMGRVLIVRAPRVFPILWTLVSTFINDTTRSKFIFYGSTDHYGPRGLQEFIQKDHIPDFLGGACETNLCEGGLVPKSFYMSEEEYEKEKSDGMHLFDDSMYHIICLGKGQVHEVIISINDKGSVICWDFDILKADVSFGVYRTKSPLPPMESLSIEPSHQSSAHSHNTSAIGKLNLDTPVPSVIPKSWVLGLNYFSVEATLICHDGESVQGSHVTSHEGTYILQWKHIEAPHHHSFDFPLSSHKAKVMYFYEVLKSQDYKGSMSSLQSSYSGTTSTSALSGASTCPSR